MMKFANVPNFGQFVEYVTQKYTIVDNEPFGDVVAYVTQDEGTLKVIEKLKEIVSYPHWKEKEAVKIGDVRMYERNLYTVVQAHTTQSDWTPDITPALWKKFYEPNVIPDWVQPLGAHDAYNIGDRVRFEGKVYESRINANVWSPTAYPQGWQEVIE